MSKYKKNYTDYSKDVKNEVIEEVSEPVEVVEETKVGTVVPAFLNVRKDANATSDIVKVVEAGDKFDILGEEGDFYKIEDGYVMKKFIEVM